jgi:hypothetical protein
VADFEHPHQTPGFPAADVSTSAGAGLSYIEGGRAVGAGRAWAWFVEGFRYFRRQPGMWILLAIIFLGLVMGLRFVPFIGPPALIVIVPVLVAGMMAGCQAIDRGGELELAHLFAGFRRNTGQLILVGVIGFALTAAVVIPVSAVVGTAGLYAAMTGSAAAVDASTLLGFLIALALIVPINMALWFAPALVMLQDHSAPRAISESFRGCIRNIVPFLLYGVVLFVLAMIASIPFGLGWLVLVPVVFGSIYAAYRDIYVPGP